MQGRWQPDGQFPVALRKESVDRNDTMQVIVIVMDVALRKESVDRNMDRSRRTVILRMSLSARRAWIEIVKCSICSIKVRSRSPQGERG